jgi:hypothetical protein
MIFAFGWHKGSHKKWIAGIGFWWVGPVLQQDFGQILRVNSSGIR